MAGVGKPGPAKGSGGRPRKKGGSRLTKGGNAGYVKLTTGSKKNPKRQYLHRKRVGAKRGQVVDHRDGVKSNNARSNLRAMTPSAHTSKTNRQRARRRGR